MEKPMCTCWAMLPGRGRMVYTASLPRTLQGVTKAVKGPATHRQGRWRQRPPCHSPSQHHPDTTPPGDKGGGWGRGQCLVACGQCQAVQQAGSGCICPWQGWRNCREGDCPPITVSGSMNRGRSPAPTDPDWDQPPAFWHLSAHGLKHHHPRAGSDHDLLRSATVKVHCSSYFKYRDHRFFVWSHCLAKQLQSCQSVDELSWERGTVSMPVTKSKSYLHA